MIPRQAILPLLGLSTIFLLAADATAAPPLQAKARVERDRVQLGEPVRVLIQVKNSGDKPDIEFPKTAGLDIGPAGDAETMPSILAGVRPLSTGAVPGQQIVESFRELARQLAADPSGMQNIPDPQLRQQYQGALNNSLTNLNRDDYTVVYLALPEKTGLLTVPSFTVRSGGQTVKTEPIQLTVTEPRPQPWVKAALSLSNPKPLAGDEVNLYIDLLVRRPTVLVGRPKSDAKSQLIRRVSLSIPRLDKYPEVDPLQSLEQFVQKRCLPPGQIGYHINNFPGMILLEQEPPPGPVNTLDPQWYRRRLTFPFRARQAGTVELPPLRVAGEVYVPGTNRRAPNVWEGFAAVSPSLSFTVRDLPNRPTDYNGTIGSCRLTVSASLTNMPAGTPFVLTLREEGHGNLSHATPPDLESQPAFRDRFVIHHETDVARSDSVREFTWTLRPRSEAVTEVPPVSLSWFDSRTEKFERVHSEAIPMRVTPAPVRSTPAPPSPVAADTSTPQEDDGQPARRSLPMGAWLAIGLAAFVIAASVFVSVRRWRGKRHQRGALSRKQQTIEDTRHRLSAKRLTATDVSAAVQDFLRARLEMPCGEITPDEAAERLTRAGYSSELAQTCAEVLRECAALQFAPGPATDSASELAIAADRVLRDILAAQPRRVESPTAPADELTRQRQAALAD